MALLEASISESLGTWLRAGGIWGPLPRCRRQADKAQAGCGRGKGRGETALRRRSVRLPSFWIRAPLPGLRRAHLLDAAFPTLCVALGLGQGLRFHPEATGRLFQEDDPASLQNKKVQRKESLSVRN